MKRNVKCPECEYARKTTKNILNDICPTCNLIMETVTTAEPLKSAPAVVSSRLPTGRKLRSLARKYAIDRYGAENINKDVPQYQIVQFEKIIEWLIKEGY